MDGFQISEAGHGDLRTPQQNDQTPDPDFALHL